ncbi:NADH-ubiquinone oxidoreductase assembly factor N7BML [Zalerion maritima]|uniref:NADH-ubiquinone oxidoreductase assembly factor N7BML n=1 Tax=Zalerion maritima TaxID=339359 RepID=A0AAD5WVP0_9PEZI|nr:NADH-ubiquinone oxidoreductase assembly factor N7BML [Zalerion maritima]
MSARFLSPFHTIWARWKALRLPWRTQVLVGKDLKGNTYWEFPDARGMAPGRMRRIVKYPRGTHLSQVKVPPMWHQWLRHQRPQPPSIRDQQVEEVRQERIKILAAQADARWEAKPRIAGGHAAPKEKTVEDLNAAAGDSTATAPKTDESPKPQASAQDATEPARDNPWKKAQQGGPSESWQPEPWTAGGKKKQ